MSRARLLLLTATLGLAPAALAVPPAGPPEPLPTPAPPMPEPSPLPPEPPAPAPRWDVLGDPASPSLLNVPEACLTRACPLVVVAHPRAQSPERLRDSTSVRVLLDALRAAGFPVLLAGDGGPLNWGSPATLAALGQTHRAATGRFAWNGRTYALGLSMGGLLALRSALPGGPFAVSGVALIDAWADLRGAWGTALSRREEIGVAYALSGAPTPDLDPLPLTLAAPPPALWLVGGPDDQSVPYRSNAERLAAHARPGVSELITLPGPHLGGNRFTPELAARLVGFFARLEGLVQPDPAARSR